MDGDKHIFHTIIEFKIVFCYQFKSRQCNGTGNCVNL